MRKIKKINNFFKVFLSSFVLLFSVTINLTTANSIDTDIGEEVNYLLDQLSINKDEVLIYILGPVYEGEEILSTKGHVLDVPEKGYIIYIDLYPKTNLFHPVKY